MSTATAATGSRDAVAGARRGWQWWPAIFFLALSVVLGTVVWQSHEHLPWNESNNYMPTSVADGILGPWLRWDAGAHADIADNGYTAADVAVFEHNGESRVDHFPGYPLAVRAVSTITRDTGLALVLTTFACGLALAMVFARWCARFLDERAVRFSVAALLLFPFAFFFVGTGYSESLFLLLAVGAFLLVETDHPVLAGLVGAYAAFTRNVGIGLLIGLALRLAERRGALRLDGWRIRFQRRKLRPADPAVALTALGLLAFMAFCAWRYSDAFAFSTVQRGWGQPPGLRTFLKVPLWDALAHDPDKQFQIRLLIQGLVGLAFCAAIPAVWRRFGSGYAAYSFVVLVIPMLGSGNFSSMGRYAMAAFPVFAVAGTKIADERPERSRAALVVSGALLLLLTSMWGRGYWVS